MRRLSARAALEAGADYNLFEVEQHLISLADPPRESECLTYSSSRWFDLGCAGQDAAVRNASAVDPATYWRRDRKV